jgi:hypothetical protein
MPGRPLNPNAFRFLAPDRLERAVVPDAQLVKNGMALVWQRGDAPASRQAADEHQTAWLGPERPDT